MYVPQERRKVILAMLEQHGYIRTATIADKLNITKETIRNDLIYLQEKGLLKRVRAGARYLPPTGDSLDSSYLSSRYISILQRFLPKRCCIYADDSPLIRYLFAHSKECVYSVVTPSLSLAQFLCVPALPHSVLLPYGTLHKPSHMIEADSASDMLDFLQRHRPDIALLCPPAVTTPYSVSYCHDLQAAWTESVSQIASERILIVMPDARNSLFKNRVQLIPTYLVGPENLPIEFHVLPHDFFPITTVDDIREAVQN